MDQQLGLFPDEPSARRADSPGAVTPDPETVAVAAALPPSLRMGTSSWSFPGWAGIVYERAVAQSKLARHGLEAYGAHPLLRTVGVDRTYYRPMEADDFRAWAEVVPPDFRFLVKADRLLTFPHDPEGYGAQRTNPLFLDPVHAAERVVAPMVDGLGDRAGPLLFQFPPIAPAVVGGARAFLDRLGRFVRALPAGPTYAIEFRTPAFLTEEYAAMLESTGVAHCYNVHPAMTPIDRQIRRVSPFYQPALVVRWMLHEGLRYEAAKDRYQPFDRIVDDDTVSRDRIAVAVLDAMIAERPAFVIVNNKAEGSAPLSVFRLARRVADWSPNRGGARHAR